ncbi:hypothetical protein C8R44DRAFT_747692 [Mycena epipterygia]|nr:hypothetical protein C8R44DRAFT_747692 [Mycena epipterygia]
MLIRMCCQTLEASLQAAQSEAQQHPTILNLKIGNVGVLNHVSAECRSLRHISKVPVCPLPVLHHVVVPNPQMGKQVILGLVIPGVSLTTALLILYGYAAWNPVSRRYLDRVSFRLLVYALLARLVFEIVLPLGHIARVNC